MKGKTVKNIIDLVAGLILAIIPEGYATNLVSLASIGFGVSGLVLHYLGHGGLDPAAATALILAGLGGLGLRRAVENSSRKR